LNLESLSVSAKDKGLHLIGCGDFTHPVWQKELCLELISAEEGFFIHKSMDKDDSTRFVLQTEVSNIYKRHGKVRRVHNLILCKSFDCMFKVTKYLEKYGKLESDGRPILKLDSEEMLRNLLDISSETILIPAHIWTPWYAMFGSKSGFNCIEECFGDLTNYIYAVETGLSSDASMNRLCKDLDGRTLLSFSDAHSLPSLARNFTIVDAEFSYGGLKHALMGKKGTQCKPVDLFPEVGKYFHDGHRKCGICMHPSDSSKCDEICPECGKPMVIGVLNRVYQLADCNRKDDNQNSLYIVPLDELISSLLGKGIKTKVVQNTRNELIKLYGNEIDILLNKSIVELENPILPDLGKAINAIRNRNVEVTPGYDGVYGKIDPVI
jgi:uncharacterized protein (TIGR00375 family)